MVDRTGAIDKWALWEGEPSRVRDPGSRVGLPVFSPDGGRCAVCDSNGELLLIDLESSKASSIAGGCQAFGGKAFSADGAVIAYVRPDHSIRIVDTDGAEMQTLTGHHGLVIRLAFDAEGHYLASASHDHTIRVWDLEHGSSRVLSDHSAEVARVLFTKEGGLLSTGHDGQVRYWPTPTADPVPREAEALSGWLESISTAVVDVDGRALSPNPGPAAR
jgi:WD40 repeat protein